MKIGELAAKTEVSRDTIRLYEKMGLLASISRPYEYNNYKEYGEENVDRILMIKHFKKLGFTLKEGREMIEAIDNDSFQEESRVSFLQNKLDDIDQKIKELEQVKVSLQQMLSRKCTSEDHQRAERIKKRELSS